MPTSAGSAKEEKMSSEENILRRAITEHEEAARRLEEKLAEERIVIEALHIRLSTVRGEPTPEKPAFALEDESLTVKEAAAFLGVSDRYIYRLARTGDIPVMKIGSRDTFLKKDLIDYRAGKRRPSQEELAERAEMILTARRLNAPKRGRRRKGAANV
jgi:excisionase family DNA binding protein